MTRSGRPVAELRPLPKAPLGAAALIERRRQLPAIDPVRLRDDIDALINGSL